MRALPALFQWNGVAITPDKRTLIVAESHGKGQTRAGQVYHRPLRSVLYRIAAVTLVCVFASWSTLARMHDPVSTRDDVHRFRLSKNIERPHEKVGVELLLVRLKSHVEPDLSVGWLVVEAVPPAIDSTLTSHLTARAPPNLLNV